MAGGGNISGLMRFFFSLRYLMVLGSFGAMVGALLMFVVGGEHLAEAVGALTGHEEGAATRTMVFVLEAIDAFLFGIVLVMFAYGIAVGFIFRLSDEATRILPKWMKVEGVGQLKQILSEVVIVVLVVIFARLVVEAQGKFEWTMLVIPASILMIAAAIRLLGLGDEHGGGDNENSGH